MLDRCLECSFPLRVHLRSILRGKPHTPLPSELLQHTTEPLHRLLHSLHHVHGLLVHVLHHLHGVGSVVAVEVDLHRARRAPA